VLVLKRGKAEPQRNAMLPGVSPRSPTLRHEMGRARPIKGMPGLSLTVPGPPSNTIDPSPSCDGSTKIAGGDETSGLIQMGDGGREFRERRVES
jgi:hypothetical protein